MGPANINKTTKGSSVKPRAREQPKKRRSLLDLPAELWSRICLLAATPDRPLIIPLDATRADYHRLLSQPSITRTCRAIRTETLKHFYGSAVMQIEQRSGDEDLTLLEKWLNAIGEKNQRDIRSLPFGSLQQYFKDKVEILVIPLKVTCPLGPKVAGEDGNSKVLGEGGDEDDVVASVRRYVLGPEPIDLGICEADE